MVVKLVAVVVMAVPPHLPSLLLPLPSLLQPLKMPMLLPSRETLLMGNLVRGESLGKEMSNT